MAANNTAPDVRGGFFSILGGIAPGGNWGGCARTPEARLDRYVAKQLIEKRDYARALLEFRNAAQPNAEVYYQNGPGAECNGRCSRRIPGI